MRNEAITESKSSSRRKSGEAVVSEMLRQAIRSGATLEQLQRETGRDLREIERLLHQLDRLEELTRDSSFEDK